MDCKFSFIWNSRTIELTNVNKYQKKGASGVAGMDTMRMETDWKEHKTTLWGDGIVLYIDQGSDYMSFKSIYVHQKLH